MRTVEIEKPIKDVKVVETPEQYLQKEFPLSGKEYKVDFKSVGENNFRVNFWSYQLRDNALSQFKSSRISRSYYVTLKRKNSSWSHTIG